jgi:uncharacterized membrane protein
MGCFACSFIQHAVMSGINWTIWIVWVAGIAWTIGVIICTPLTEHRLGKIDASLSKHLDEAVVVNQMINDLTRDRTSGKNCTVTKDTNGKFTVTEPNDDNGNPAKPANTCLSCAQAHDIVKKTFYHGDEEEYVFNTRHVGRMFTELEEILNKTESSDCDVYRAGNDLGKLEKDIGAFMTLQTDRYVLEKTRLGLWVSLGAIIGAVLFVGLSEYLKRTRVESFDGHLVHWTYTSLVFLSFFTFVVCFVVSFTREFWVDSVNKLVMAGVPQLHGDKYVENQDHVDTSTLLMLTFVFQILAFAAHFTAKYGPLVQISEKIADKVANNGSRISNKVSNKVSSKVQYAPLVSVARRA